MPNLKDVFCTAVTALLFLVLATLLTYNRSNAAGAIKSTAPAQGYYLTTATFDGSHALTACIAGYHMASVWEVHEPSNLRYDTNLGFKLDDSGFGPPTGYGGWIRTGFVSNVTGNTGVVNCGVWSSNSAFDSGTQVNLQQDYINSGPASTPWFGGTFSCNFPSRVWCVQD
jgi:hypothetical protein